MSKQTLLEKLFVPVCTWRYLWKINLTNNFFSTNRVKQTIFSQTSFACKRIDQPPYYNIESWILIINILVSGPCPFEIVLFDLLLYIIIIYYYYILLLYISALRAWTILKLIYCSSHLNTNFHSRHSQLFFIAKQLPLRTHHQSKIVKKKLSPGALWW